MARMSSLLIVFCFALSALVACGGSYRAATPDRDYEFEEEEFEEEIEDEEIEEPRKAEVVVTDEEIVIGDRIQFRTGKARLLRESETILDQVAMILKEHEDIAVVRIEGHTDDRGGRRYNRKLSRKRARAVKDYLVDQGIDEDRLTIEGYGLSRPLASNDTRAGRYQNRRVEFKILERN